MIKIHPIVLEILEARGIKSEEKINEYFSAKPQCTYNPFLLSNIEAGVDLLLKAIDNNKRIVIYGDYDADGVTSTTVMMKAIGALTDNLTYYLPSRMGEGYGLNCDAIKKIHDEGGEMIITVDCGAVSAKEINYAWELGIETIITDHHTIQDVIAPGIVIDPKEPGDGYPFKGLAGVGVAYKFILALNKKRTLPKGLITELLDIVTIGTVGDIMPLTDENRTLVKYGLRLINSGHGNKGLMKLIELSSLNYETITSVDISFGIVPKINAAGRMADASIGVKLFLSDNDDEIEEYCRELIETNTLRKSMQEKGYKDCIVQVESELKNDDFLLIENNTAHEGILGIVAGKIKEKYNRPTVIVTESGDYYKGTGRSIPGVDLYEMLNRYQDLFIKFGGHKAACGFSIEEQYLKKLKENLNEDISKMKETKPNMFDTKINIDAAITVDSVNMEIAKAINEMQPFGEGNEEPVFGIKGVSIRNWKYIGKGEQYAKFDIADKYNRVVHCINFKNTEKYYEMYNKSTKVEIYGTISINTWRSNSSIQFKTVAVKQHGE